MMGGCRFKYGLPFPGAEPPSHVAATWVHAPGMSRSGYVAEAVHERLRA